MSITEILLAVCVLILVWRVWRLEDKMHRVDSLSINLKQETIWRTAADNERPTYAAYDGINGRLNALAHALGYEWKRTEAKEGWEKKARPMGLYDYLKHKVDLVESIDPTKRPTKKPTKKRRATH